MENNILDNSKVAPHLYTNISHAEHRVSLVLKCAVKALMVPCIRLYRSNRAFTFRNVVFKYFVHGYNTTWLNERSVEIPVVLSFIDTRKRILEVGNVLSHYTNTPWDILDKFEEGKGIINNDIVDFRPKEPYDLIVSISTLEHVGFDDDEKDTTKIIKTILNLKEHCLAPGGKMIVTLPIGYNKEMDNMLFSGRLFFDEIYFLKRISKKNEWKEARVDETVGAHYGHPYPGANCVCIGVITK